MSTGRPASRAAAGATAWRATAAGQLRAAARHEDIYALLGEMVQTVYALDDLAKVLGGQIARYGQGRAVYDDSRYGGMPVAPEVRLAVAVRALDEARRAFAAAAGPLNAAWSAIGHIGVDPSRCGR